jgi:hypothetical protein
MIPDNVLGQPPRAAKLVPVERLSAEEKALFAAAQELLKATEHKLTALVRAASERWVPAQSAYDTDETEGPVFSDTEFASFCDLVEVMSEAEMMRQIGTFLGLPQQMLNELASEKLKGRLLPQAPKPGVPFVMRHGRRAASE